MRSPLDDFVKYRLDSRFFASPYPGLTLACLGRAGYIQPYVANRAVPEDQLFFLGGQADARGFGENLLRVDEDGEPLGGRTMVSGGLEARIYLVFNFELALFYDLGSLQDSFPELFSQGFRSSAGIGLRYLTPVGPLGILYALNLDPRAGESAGNLIFSLGYTF